MMTTTRNRALRASASSARRRRRSGRAPLIDPAIVAKLIEIRDGMDAREGDDEDRPAPDVFEGRDRWSRSGALARGDATRQAASDWDSETCR